MFKPKTVQKKLLSRIEWNLAWRTFNAIQVTSSRQFLKFGPWARLRGGAPGEENWQYFFLVNYIDWFIKCTNIIITDLAISCKFSGFPMSFSLNTACHVAAKLSALISKSWFWQNIQWELLRLSSFYHMNN